MKKLLYTLFLILGIGYSTFAQQGNKGEKIESLKIAFIAGKLNLDPKTAEKFWPLYNQYDNEMHGLMQEFKAAKHSDDQQVEDMLDQQQKALDLKRKYTAIFLKVISNEQVSQLFRAEKEFRQMVLKRAKRN
ncbi:MAG: hypothetical protein KA198_02005 [Chitinophagaceae bacterium]|nr:hypothetical protein [Chitinophagaceae bacterium]